MKKYNREDFYIVTVKMNEDKGKREDFLPSKIVTFDQMYSPNNSFALCLKKDGLYFDIINNQIFGEDTTFCIGNKISLDSYIGEKTLTIKDAVSEMVNYVPDLAVKWRDASEWVEEYNPYKSFTIPSSKQLGLIGKSFLNFSGGSITKLNQSEEQFNTIVTEKSLNNAEALYCINNFYLSLVILKSMILKSNENTPIADFTLLLKLSNGSFYDLGKKQMVDLSEKFILFQEPLGMFYPSLEALTKEEAIKVANDYRDRFLSRFKYVMDYNYSVIESENKRVRKNVIN